MEGLFRFIARIADNCHRHGDAGLKVNWGGPWGLFRSELKEVTMVE